MIYKTIPIMERADGSLQIDTNKVKLTQGDYNFNINYFTKEDYSDVSPNINVQVSFRRKDGQQTGWLPLTHIRGNQYTINLKSTWFTKVEGNMYLTFRVFQTTSNDVNLIINTTSGTLIVNPTSAFNTPEPDIIPSEFEIYMSQTNDKFKKVDDELSDLRNDLSLSQLGKGIFDTEQELLNTYPNGVDYPEGTWAVLLSTNTVWLYNSQTKQWYNSGKDVTEIFDLDDNVYRFSKQLYEESLNEFDKNNVEYLQGFAFNEIIFSYSGYRIVVIPIEQNTDYSFKCFWQWIRIALLENYPTKGDLVSKRDGEEYTFNSGSNNYLIIGEISDNNYEKFINNFVLVKGTEKPTKNFDYNAKRHITNPQAEFLKDEFGKNSNDFNINNNYFSTQDNGTKIVLKNVSEKIKYSIDENKITINSYDTSGYNWLSTTAKLEKNEDYFISFVAGTGNVKVVGINSLEIGSIGTVISSGNNQTFNSGNYNYYIISLYPTEAGMTFSNIMINKGKKALPYQPYNSASHITNSQADFLKSEFEKSVNEANIPDVGITTQRGIDYSSTKGAITLNGTATNTFSIEYDIDFKSSNGCVLSAFNNTKYDETNNGYIQLRRKGGDWSDYVDFKQINNYKVISGEVEFDKIRILITSGYTVNNLVVKPMLVKGNVIPPEFRTWNGYPLHPKDIKPTLLWENATPSSFTTVNERLALIKTIKKQFAILYTTGGNWHQRKIDVFYYNSGWTGYLNCNGEFGNAYRKFDINESGIMFYDCYVNGTVNNNCLIPYKVYEINMLWED